MAAIKAGLGEGLRVGASLFEASMALSMQSIQTSKDSVLVYNKLAARVGASSGVVT